MLEFVTSSSGKFDFASIENSFELPAVLLTVNFSGDQNFQFLLLMSKKLVAILSDLMMLGDGDVEYMPEEHNDAVQEMFNQVLGSLNSELAASEISLTGTITQVELTDMEIQKDFLEDNAMSVLSTKLLDTDHNLFLFYDSFAETSITNLFKSEPEESEPANNSKPNPSDNQSIEQPPRQEEPPVNVSRASFAPMSEDKFVSSGNINIDRLHDIPLHISVELGRKEMKIKEILEMGQGSVVELDKTAGDYVDLIINGKKFAIGEVMVADENYAVRIVSLVSRQERIKSLTK